MTTPGLHYPHADPPEPGEARFLAPGVGWLRLPVPGGLRHINVWLLASGGGWTLIDTGMDVPAARSAWNGSIGASLDGRPIRRIVCTHHHPDHAGLAVWLAARHGAAVQMGAEEYRLMRAVADAQSRARERLEFWAQTGLGITAELTPVLTGEAYARVISGVPAEVLPLADGELLETDAGPWEIRLLGGHSDGLAVLHQRDTGMLIASDQVLPRITSNIGCYPERRDPEPLSTYLASFAALEALCAAPLVLPSHGNVFTGLKFRLGELRAHHASTLANVEGLIVEPRTAADVARGLFGDRPDPLNTMLAVAEALAHLRHLVAHGRATTTGDAPCFYQRRQA